MACSLFKVTSHIRGYPSEKKIRRRASFSKILANRTSEENLINAVYEKNL